MESFVEVRFPANISRGCVGGPMFNTQILSGQTSKERRLPVWGNARRTFNVTHGLKTNPQRDTLVSFFQARRGKAVGFRFKDWMDFTILTPQPLVSLGDGVSFQIVKWYFSGGIAIPRTITKPVNLKTKIYDADGVEEITEGFTVCITSGKVVFDVEPGFIPTITTEFDIPARFDTDGMNYSQDESTFGSWSQIPIIEINHTSDDCYYAAGVDNGDGTYSNGDGTSTDIPPGLGGSGGSGGSGDSGAGEDIFPSGGWWCCMGIHSLFTTGTWIP